MQPYTIAGTKNGSTVSRRSVYEKALVPVVAYVHCFHSFPFIGEFGTEVTCTYSFQITLCAAFFNGEPVVCTSKSPLCLHRVFVCPLTQHQVQMFFCCDAWVRISVRWLIFVIDVRVHVMCGA